jgi:hypothetical protein
LLRRIRAALALFGDQSAMARDEDLLLPNDKFTRTLEFAGIFEAGERRTPPFSIELGHSTINSHVPKGIIRGTGKDYEVIERFFMSSRPPTCVLRSSSEKRESIVCKEVLMHGLSNRMFPDDEKGTIHQVIGHFSFEEVEIRRLFGVRPESARKRAQFIMDGPSALWMTYSQQVLADTGEIENQVHDSSMFLDNVPEAIEARPHYVYAQPSRKSGSVKEVVQAKLFSVIVDAPGADLRSIEEFMVHSSEIADTLCLLVGFLSKSPIRWFSSTYVDGNILIERHRAAKANSDEPPHWDEVVLSSKCIRQFLSTAFAAFRTAPIARLPVLYYIWSQSARFVEDRFTVLFFALEKMLSFLDKMHPEPALLSDPELTALWKTVRPSLLSMGKSPEQAGLIQEKRSELKRPPLRHKICRHLRTLSINLDDVGGDEGLRKMIRVRNRLTHDGEEVPIDEVVFETKRLETIVERMLLRLLGWSGDYHTPTSNNRSILSV